VPAFKKCPPRGLVRARSRLVGRIGSGVRVSASFQKNSHLVGRLGPGPRLVADRADVVRADVMFTHTP